MSGNAMDDAIHKLAREQAAKNLWAHNIVSVQPMTQPLASILYIKYSYGSPKGPKLVQGYLFDDTTV